ncbi:MAG: hypothetical protein ACU0BK_04970 [Shimia sp.]|uniref:hypothetical protein n=1 Tax=Shimia sp. TaxID=1954381 RepID=UPI004059E26D
MKTDAAIDAMFGGASRIVSALPTSKDENSFYDLVDVSTKQKRRRWEEGATRLAQLAHEAPDEKKSYFLFWAGDALTGLGELERALQTKPQPLLGSRNSMQTDRILSLKLALGELVSGLDIATLFGPKFTKFGRENIESVVAFLEPQVEQLQARGGRNLLLDWTKDAHTHPHGMPLFNGHASYVLAKSPTDYSFSLSPSAEKLSIELMREAENTFREERNIPRVGEGWVAETALFYEVRDAFPDETVIQHGRPKWLGRQHLDILMPDRGVAVEYQGEQHDRPVEFFGGEEAFRKNVERDRKKLLKCKRNGVRVIYVRAGYDLPVVISEILSGRSE